MRIEYLLAASVSKEEFNTLLKTGWRRFGYYFFRPQCETCFDCIPIRIRVNEFSPTKSLRRIINKNKDTKIRFGELNYSDEIFEIYKEHSKDRFNQDSNKQDFIQTFFFKAVPSMQSEYYLGDELIAVGFLDISNEALSSVYFVYKTKYTYLNLGFYSAVKEIECVKALDLKYYYLGYYIKENKSMSYKNRFRPYDIYDWKNKIWISY